MLISCSSGTIGKKVLFGLLLLSVLVVVGFFGDIVLLVGCFPEFVLTCCLIVFFCLFGFSRSSGGGFGLGVVGMSSMLSSEMSGSCMDTLFG